MEPTEMPFVDARADAAGDFFKAVLLEDQDSFEELVPGDNIELSYEEDLEALAIVPKFSDGSVDDANASAYLAFNPAIDTVIGRTISVDIAVPASYNLSGEGDLVSLGVYTFNSSDGSFNGGPDCAFFESKPINTFDEWITVTFDIPDAETGIGFGASAESGQNCGTKYTGTSVDTVGFNFRLGGAPKAVEETVYIDNFVITNVDASTTTPTPTPTPTPASDVGIVVDFDEATVGSRTGGTTEMPNGFTIISGEENPLNDTPAAEMVFNQDAVDNGQSFSFVTGIAPATLKTLITAGEGDKIAVDYHYTSTAVDENSQVQISFYFDPPASDDPAPTTEEPMPAPITFAGYFPSAVLPAVGESSSGTLEVNLDNAPDFPSDITPYSTALSSEDLTLSVAGSLGGDKKSFGTLVLDNIRVIQGGNSSAE